MNNVRLTCLLISARSGNCANQSLGIKHQFFNCPVGHWHRRRSWLSPRLRFKDKADPQIYYDYGVRLPANQSTGTNDYALFVLLYA